MRDDSRLIIYGANGYTGEITARLAKEQGMTPVLAGRSEAPVAALARDLGLEHRAFGLDDPATLDAGLEGAKVVLHCAGPFSRTAAPMVDACLRKGAHYLDITGEVGVFEAVAARDAEARQRGVMLMPGAGFDVVPSDCLAAHLARRLPDATHLVLAFAGLGGGVSHGTALTMVENIHRGGLVRRDGALFPVPPGSLHRQIDYGRGPRLSMAIPWGDVSTAYRSTGIPDIEVYTPASWPLLVAARLGGFFPGLLGSRPVQRFLSRRVEARPKGPTPEERAAGRSVLWGEVLNAAGQRASARLTTPNGYTLTAVASLEIARRALSGDAPIGYQTPSLAYGPDLILSFEGTSREDLDAR